MKTLRLLLLSALTSIAVVVTLGLAAGPADATEYPSWGDVSAARENEASAKAEITRIEDLLAGLSANAATTRADAESKGALWEKADEKFQESARRAQNLQGQADDAESKAIASGQRAGQMAAQLMRGGGRDLVSVLLTSGSKADGLLYSLGMSQKVSEQANAIYERAIQDKNTAQALTDQADVAKSKLEALKVAAQKIFADAQAASIAAAAALQEQEANQARLQQQLTVLTEQREATEADYLAGVQARVGGGASLGAGEISLSGWALPTAGYITDGFGPRIHPVYGGYSFHQGTDIAADCDQSIYAASSGTVIYAGWNGSYGNFVLIDHGGGTATGYAHITDGGILVSYGEQVSVGQNIARVGSTGASTGCHLHFEVRINGVATDPQPFMAGQGIRIG